MQDQLTGNSSNLQQQQGNLQQSTPNLQQSGTPTSTSDVSGLLSENAQTSQLQVTTVPGSNSTIQADAAVQNGGSSSWILWVLIAAVLIGTYIVYRLWTRIAPVAEAEIIEEQEETPVIEPAKPKKTTKAKKKVPKHRQSKRR